MPERPRPRRWATPLLALAAIVVALWPYAAVIQGRSWVGGVLAVACTTIAVGALCRRLLPRRGWAQGPVTVAVQLGIVVAAVTVLCLRETAWIGFVPTAGSVHAASDFVLEAIDAIWVGSAPLPETAAMTFVLLTAFGALALTVDTLLAHDRVVVAAVAVATVGATPMIITRSAVDLWWFVLFAVLLLVVLRRSAAGDPDSPRRSSLPLAATVGILAIVGTMYAAPTLPLSARGFGPTNQVALNPTLDLGEDLRQPENVDVVTVATDAGRAPYLRIATLSDFDGEVWSVDESATQPVSFGFSPINLPDGLKTQSTSIRVQNVTGSWLPLPYPAISVSGLTDAWQAMPDNRSIITHTASPTDQDYTITTLMVDPTLEQMRDDRAAGVGDPAHRELPADVPANVTALAAEVTAGLTTDYDRLSALQDWFRSEFRYSLDTPVEEGFDGSGVEAVGRFLEVRSGYCVHFSAAFALMARSLDLPTRIVVGFLPGTATDVRRGEETIYAVGSDRLHAWPEVHFATWGWVAFEPTATLGTPTRFASSAEREQDPTDAPSEAPIAETTGPTSEAPEVDRAGDDEEIAESGSPAVSLDLLPVAIGAAALIVALLIPAALRRLRRLRRHARAARGDAGAAWAELNDLLADLWIPISDAESPRERSIRLRTAHGVTTPALDALVTALERAAFARDAPAGADLRAPLGAVERDLRAAARPGNRVAAVLAPRSLLPAGAGRVPLASAVR